MGENGGYEGYKDLLDELDKDTRVGDHDFLVNSVTTGRWADLTPNGSQDPYVKVDGVLLTAAQAKCDFTWSPPPPASVIKDQMASWEPGKRKAIAGAIRLGEATIKHYGKTVDGLKSGDVLRVKTVKTKVKADGKGGFIRIVAILPKDQIGQASTQTAADLSEIPY
jgi:hypothetical protein